MGHGADDTRVRWGRVAELHPSHQHGDAVEQQTEQTVGGCEGIAATGEFPRSFALDYRCLRAAMD